MAFPFFFSIYISTAFIFFLSLSIIRSDRPRLTGALYLVISLLYYLLFIVLQKIFGDGDSLSKAIASFLIVCCYSAPFLAQVIAGLYMVISGKIGFVERIAAKGIKIKLIASAVAPLLLIALSFIFWFVLSIFD